MFQTALEHINLNSNNCIKIQQFKSIFCGKKTKGIPSARAGHHRTPHGSSDRHLDSRVSATKKEKSRLENGTIP